MNQNKKHSVVGIIVSHNCVLLLKRFPHDRTLPNVLCLPGGKREAEESRPDALIREVKEETDLDVIQFNYISTQENDRFVIDFYLIETFDLNVTISDEHETYHWIPLQNLELYVDQIAPLTYKVLTNHFNL